MDYLGFVIFGFVMLGIALLMVFSKLLAWTKGSISPKGLSLRMWCAPLR
jgi:hypothetical protein